MNTGLTETEKAKKLIIQRREMLLTILRVKYLYREDKFGDRTLMIEPGTSSGSSLLCGFVFCTTGGAPFLLAAANPEGDDERSTGEAFQYALATETIGLVVVLPTKHDTPKFFRRRFDQNKFDEIPDLEYYCKGALGPQGVLLDDANPYRATTKASTQQPLLPISNKLESIFFELHSCMRDIDGLHADAALDELCKLLYVKIYDEDLFEQKDHEALHTLRFGCCEEYAASIRQLYREAINYDLRVFRLKIPQYERSRGVFAQPIRLSSAAVTRSFQLIENFSLSKSRSDVKGRAFQQVLGRTVRAGMGQYFTPVELCEMTVGIVQPQVSQLILDPFCDIESSTNKGIFYLGRDADIPAVALFLC
jgi:type I restriction enzyme M protein